MEQRVGPRLLICRLLYLRLTSSDGWNIIIAKLSKNPKLKLQLLAEMVMISINPELPVDPKFRAKTRIRAK